MKRIKDKEFMGWQAMTSLRGNTIYWIYFSPDNLQSALVNTINDEIIFIMDRASGEQVYRSRNSQKHAKFFYAMKSMPRFSPRKVT